MRRESVYYLVTWFQVNNFRSHTHRSNDHVGQLKHTIRLVGSYIENLVVRSFTQNRMGDNWPDITDVRKSPGLLAIPEDGHRFVLHDPIHENADHISVAVSDVLTLAIDVMWPKDDAVQPEHFVTFPDV